MDFQLTPKSCGAFDFQCAIWKRVLEFWGSIFCEKWLDFLRLLVCLFVVYSSKPENEPETMEWTASAGFVVQHHASSCRWMGYCGDDLPYRSTASVDHVVAQHHVTVPWMCVSMIMWWGSCQQVNTIYQSCCGTASCNCTMNVCVDDNVVRILSTGQHHLPVMLLHSIMQLYHECACGR